MPRYSATISIKVSLILIPFPPIAGSKVVLMDAACILPLFRQRFPNRPILYTRPARLSTLFLLYYLLEDRNTAGAGEGRNAGGLLKESPRPPRTFLEFLLTEPRLVPVSEKAAGCGGHDKCRPGSAPRRGTYTAGSARAASGSGAGMQGAEPPAALAIPAPGERTISNAAVACDG